MSQGTSAGCVVVHSCNDKDISCASWVRDGLCETDEVVKDLCPHSCGTCTLTCEDSDVSCASWAKQGDCINNPDYVLKHCPVECGLCKAKCKDLHQDCHVWQAAGECTNNTA